MSERGTLQVPKHGQSLTKKQCKISPRAPPEPKQSLTSALELALKTALKPKGSKQATHNQEEERHSDVEAKPERQHLRSQEGHRPLKSNWRSGFHNYLLSNLKYYYKNTLTTNEAEAEVGHVPGNIARATPDGATPTPRGDSSDPTEDPQLRGKLVSSTSFVCLRRYNF